MVVQGEKRFLLHEGRSGFGINPDLESDIAFLAVQKNCSLTQRLDGEKDHTLATIQSPCCHFSFLSIETDTRKNTGKSVCVCVSEKERKSLEKQAVFYLPGHLRALS